MPWNEAFVRLTQFAKAYPCSPPSPPKPLILAGWTFSNDVEKMQRWENTVAWANSNGCPEFVTTISDSDFYFAGDPTTCTVGPTGDPMYRRWDFDAKPRPSSEEIVRHFETLTSRWSEIVGLDLAHITHPLAFTGRKARRLLVQAEPSTNPPWGGWAYLSPVETDRRTFTRLRTAINSAIAPHEIDHIDFTTDAEPIIPPGAARWSRAAPVNSDVLPQAKIQRHAQESRRRCHRPRQ